jgi:hypothetical protein
MSQICAVVSFSSPFLFTVLLGKITDDGIEMDEPMFTL